VDDPRSEWYCAPRLAALKSLNYHRLPRFDASS
jgi:hypothetical protein